MTRRYGRATRLFKARGSRLTPPTPAGGSYYGDWCGTHYCLEDEVCIQLDDLGVCISRGMFTHDDPRDPGWHSTGAPRINSFSSVRHMAFSGKKYQIIYGKNLQTIQRVYMKRVHAAHPIVTELPILDQSYDGLQMKVSVPDSAGINFGQGKGLFLTDMQPWTFEFGPGDIGASKLFSSKPSASSRSGGAKRRTPRKSKRKIRGVRRSGRRSRVRRRR